MESVESIEKLREDYERSPETTESWRAYHEAVLGLIDGGGQPLREFSEQLGWSDQQLDEITSVRPSPVRRRRNLARSLAALCGVVALLAWIVLGLRLAQLPPFVPVVRVPAVLHLPVATASQRIRDAGLNVRILPFRRSLPSSLYHRVLGVTEPANVQLAKGSTITLYVAIPSAKTSKAHH